MQGRFLGVIELAKETWETFRLYAGVLLGGYLIYLTIVFLPVASAFMIVVDMFLSVVCSFHNEDLLLLSLFVLPLCQAVIVSGVIIPPLTGGLTVLMLKAVRRQDPKIEDLSAGFKSLFRFLAVYILFRVAIGLTAVPAIIAACIIVSWCPCSDWGGPAAPLLTDVFVSALIVASVWLFIQCFRYFFAFFQAADGAEIWDSFKASDEMVGGRVYSLFWRLIVIGLFSIAGIIFCGIGIVLTSLFGWLALAHMYQALKGTHGQTNTQPEAEPSPPIH